MERQRRIDGRHHFRILAFALLLLTGCSSVQYIAQATRGQMELWNKAEPLTTAVQNEHIPYRIRKVLKRVPEIRSFLLELGLKGTPNYQNYVQLDRPAVSWLVSVSHPLKFQAKRFSFPIVGSFTYIGFFNKNNALKEAEQWNIPGEWESDVRSVRAYSTLGWFNDPLLSSMFPEGEDALGELVHLLIHESVHATVYINGQSAWNESLAEFFADQTAAIILKRLVSSDSPEWSRYFDSLKDDAIRKAAFYETYLALNQLYESTLPDEKKEEIKKEKISELKTRLKIQRPINNATLIQFQTYHSGESSFQKLWIFCKKDPRAFISKVQKTEASWFQNEQTEDFSSVLDRLIESGGCD